PSPLVAAGTHRLLTAILQAIYAPQDLAEIATVLRAGQFDPVKLDGFAAQYADRFDLFHPTAPFLQTGDVPLDGWKKPEKGQTHAWSDPKPIAALFVEVPASSNRAHFHHVTDEGHALCAACCARGLVTIAAFASSGGAGIRPSINGVPPIYVLPAGSSLFESLTLSLITQGYQPPTADPQRANLAAWSGQTTVGKGTQVSAVGYLESLTFPARRMRLYPQGVTTTTCTHCGAATQITVSSLLFEMGHWLSEGSALWEDPFAAFRKPKSKGKAADVGPKPIRPDEGKALWREYSGLLLAERDDQLRPRIVQQIAKLIDRRALHETQRVRFRCIGLRTDGKAKIFEWLDEALEAPSALLTDDDAAQYIDDALGRADEARFILESSFDSHFRPERDRGGRNEKLARFKTVRARMSADYWRRLAPLFRQFIFDLADETAREATELDWADKLVREGKQAFATAADQVGERADALRARVEAQATCHRRLAAKRKEWFGE
ncbi:MAG: type I-E CRISPR-associated protein Cse1/CasA, partial [Chloroflexales bacterium]